MTDNPTTLFLTILGAGVLTFLTRLSFIALHGRVSMPDWFTRALMFVPVAVLSAITLPELLIQDGAVDISLTNARLMAGLVAILVAWRTNNVWATIGVGMAAMWILEYFLG